jgi:hypothetical protein
VGPVTGSEYSPGEIQRTLARIEQNVGSLAGSVVTKAELQLHMDGLRQQFKVIDDRHNAVVSDLAKEKQTRLDEAKERDADRKTTTRLVWGAVLAACAAVVIPLLLRGVGLS